MENNSKELKIVRRGGGLIETNSSSSHAVSICMDAKTNLKPGDPDFDLDIRDGVLYIPNRFQEFGWEWVKSNSCLTKLQYLCGFYFNSYQKLGVQKSQKKLEKILKKILGVKRVEFEWVEDYVEEYKAGGEPELRCPEINHNSYAEMRAEILENEDTIRNFLLNPNSWWYGGNDNSDPPAGFYNETKIESREDDPDAIISVDFGGTLGIIDFVLDTFPSEDDILYSVQKDERNCFLNNISWSVSKKRFDFEEPGVYSSDGFLRPNESIVLDNKLYIIYYGAPVTTLIMNSIGKPSDFSVLDLINEKRINQGTDYILAPVKLWTKDFGILFDF
jgi:hypothetical protein